MVSRTQDSGQVTVRAIIGNTVMKLSFSCLIRGFRKKKKKKKKGCCVPSLDICVGDMVRRVLDKRVFIIGG